MTVTARGAYNFPVDIFIEECCNCGMVFGMPREFKDRMRESPGTAFFCPAGHMQHYTSKTKLQVARERYDAAERDADYQRSQRQATERRLLTARQQHGKSKAALRRMREDICPVCERKFPKSKLTAHMVAAHSVAMGVSDG